MRIRLRSLSLHVASLSSLLDSAQNYLFFAIFISIFLSNALNLFIKKLGLNDSKINIVNILYWGLAFGMPIV